MNYTMKWKELRRIAEEKGWYLLRKGAVTTFMPMQKEMYF